ncbi:MAG TPA: 3-hydroxyanthranilate 3,4-dioxygenase [Gammaproteobacteria bacterium]|nr:3-hydroxyanthranilate 3,4-dioxygenase [Gammaproteobacteria bacterium]
MELTMWDLTPINFKQWIDDHRELLKPPVGNKRIYTDTGFVVQVVGGPNSRTDYHDDPGEEFFYQIEGEMELKTMQDGKPVDIPIRAGEILLIPPHLPHSPQRFENSIGLVIERPRTPDEQDGLLWFCENCHNKLYEEYFHLENIETQFPPVFDRFYGSAKNRTCNHCGAVMEMPGH